MKKQFTFCLLFIFISFSPFFAQWNSYLTDVAGDGDYASDLDAVALEYQYDETTDSLWFRVTCAAMSNTNTMDFGVNLMVDYGNVNIPGESTFEFWGGDNKNYYHRLVTIWVTGNPPNNYSGTIGISHGNAVGSFNFNEFANDLTFLVNQSEKTITIGMKREDFIPDDHLGQDFGVAAAVGTSMFWNDDIFVDPTTATVPQINIEGPITSLKNLQSKIEELVLFPSPATEKITIKSKLYQESLWLRIFDSQGIETQIQKINNQEIDISSLPKGTYFLNIYSQEKIVGSGKFIKL